MKRIVLFAVFIVIAGASLATAQTAPARATPRRRASARRSSTPTATASATTSRTALPWPGHAERPARRVRPGDGTGRQGMGPRDGSGYGPGAGGGNGTGNCDGTGRRDGVTEAGASRHDRTVRLELARTRAGVTPPPARHPGAPA